MKPKSMKNRSRNSTKNEAQKQSPKKSKNARKMGPKWNPKSDYILGEMPIGAPLVVQTVFVMKKLAPSAAKVLPRLEKRAKNDTKEPPECEHELQKSTLFGANRKCAPKADPFRIQARRTARSAYNKLKKYRLPEPKTLRNHEMLSFRPLMP